MRGNVTLNHVFNAALNGDKIGGNLTSTGGGAGLLDPETDFVPFSIKDDVVGGNITVHNLTTVWFGVIRTQVGGNVTLMNINLSDPDGNEYVTDVIAGNLNCRGQQPCSSDRGLGRRSRRRRRARARTMRRVDGLIGAPD